MTRKGGDRTRTFDHSSFSSLLRKTELFPLSRSASDVALDMRAPDHNRHVLMSQQEEEQPSAQPGPGDSYSTCCATVTSSVSSDRSAMRAMSDDNRRASYWDCSQITDSLVSRHTAGADI